MQLRKFIFTVNDYFDFNFIIKIFRNPRVNCEELPELDLSPWRDAYLYPAGAAAAATAKSA